jgi:autotransporter-associated beta strand protein
MLKVVFQSFRWVNSLARYCLRSNLVYRAKFSLAVYFLLLLAFPAPRPAGANNYTWSNAGTGDFNVGSNWVGDVIPPSNQEIWCFINNGGTMTIASGDPAWSIGDLRLGETAGGGNANTGYTIQSGDTLTLTGWLRLGKETGTTGTYTLSAGTIAATFNADIGESGAGIFNMSGGLIDMTGSDGYLNVGGGNGGNGAGSFTMSGGSIINAGNYCYLTLGDSLSSSGTMTVNNAAACINVWEFQGGNAGGTGVFNMSAGSLNATDWFAIGRLNGSTAANSTTSSFNLSGGTVTTGGGADGSQIGWNNLSGGRTVANLNISGCGQFVQRSYMQLGVNYNGAGAGVGVGNVVLGASPADTCSLTINGTAGLDAGASSGDVGNVTINAGTMAMGANPLYLGYVLGGSGNFTMTGGTLASSGAVAVWSGSGAISISQTGSGPTSLSAGSMTVGQNGASSGTLTIASGKVALTSAIYNGYGAGATGLVNISGGAISLVDLRTDSGSGTFNQSGGSITSAGGWVRLGINSGATSVYNMTGGSDAGFGNIDVGEAGSGTLNVSGVSNLSTTGALRIVGYTGGGVGVVNLNGGIITAGSVTTLTGTSTLNLNGGTLAATAATATYLQGLTTANVRNGGGFFNNNGYAITIGQSLLHSTIGGDNATDGGLTFAGSGATTLTGANGYSGGTIVSGGTLQMGSNNNSALGTGGLTANAGVLDLNGNSPTVTTLNGAAGTITSSLAGSASLTVSNGGTFSGTIEDYPALGPGNAPVSLILSGGTLALSGTNAYSGGTCVEAGTLTVASPFSLVDGSNLSVGLDAASLFATSPAAGQAVSSPSAAPPVAAVPEPSTLALLVAGAVLAGFAAWRRMSRAGRPRSERGNRGQK